LIAAIDKSTFEPRNILTRRYSMTVGWALLGPGRHAETNVIPQMKRAAGIRLVAVLSRDRARGEAFAHKHGFAKVYTSLPDLLADPDIQALYDCTPDGSHAANTIAAAKAGKHSLVEKPLALSIAEGEAAIKACRDHGVKLGVVYLQRHEQAIQEARRMIAAGEIGDVHLVRAQVNLRVSAAPPAGGNWRADPTMRSGGTLMSLGDHAFDTMTYIVDQQIEKIVAFSDATDSATRNERVAAMMMTMSKGAIGQAVSSGRVPFARRPIEIHGSSGTLIVGNPFAYLAGDGGDPRTSLEIVNKDGSNIRYFEPTECFRHEIEQFSRAIEGAGAPMTSADAALQAMRISESFYRTIRDGRVEDVSVPG
jgi:1,5-anhydro-D-fructose reductase (1,5-anhydro-D-mannitol-forming)